MKKITYLLAILLVFQVGNGFSQTTDKELVYAAIEDYVDGIYLVQPERIKKSVHPELMKKGFQTKEIDTKSISKKIIQLPFIDEKNVLEVRLTDKINKLYLFLDKKNASQFDGILGFLPDAVSKKTVITGDLKLKLI